MSSTDVFKSFASDMLSANQSVVESTISGVVDMNRVAAEAVLANKVALVSLVGQWRFSSNIQITEGTASGSTIATFLNSSATAQVSFSMPALRSQLGILSQYYRRFRATVEVCMMVQGMKQTQGAVVVYYNPIIDSGRYKAPRRVLTIDNVFRLPHTIVPFMAPSVTVFKLPWINQMSTRPLEDGRGVRDYIQTPLTITLDPDVYLGNSLSVVVLDPLQIVAGVAARPEVAFFLRLTDVELGVYEPRVGSIPV